MLYSMEMSACCLHILDSWHHFYHASSKRTQTQSRSGWQEVLICSFLRLGPEMVMDFQSHFYHLTLQKTRVRCVQDLLQIVVTEYHLS